MENEEPLGFMNGAFVSAREMTLSVADRGVAHGVAVTEFMRTFGGELIFLEKHLNRFHNSADLCQIPLERPVSALLDPLRKLVSHNLQFLPAGRELGLILSATPGINPTYTGQRPSGPTLYAHTFELPAELWAQATQTGVALAVSQVPAVPDQCVPASAKSRSRMNWYLAEQDVRKRFPGAQSLVLDLEGNVCETSTANIFLVKNGHLVTPPAASVLPGIARQTTLEVADELGIKTHERKLSVGDCFEAEEVFVTSTPYCLLPVSRFCEPALEWTVPGAVTERLRNRWWERIGFDGHAQLRLQADARLAEDLS